MHSLAFPGQFQIWWCSSPFHVQEEVPWLDGHVQMVHMCSFICSTYTDMTAHIKALKQRGALKPLECTFHIVAEEHRRDGKVTIPQQHLVSLLVTHPRTNWAHACLN